MMVTASLSMAGCSKNPGESTSGAQSTVQEAAKIERVNTEKFESMLSEYPDAQLIDVRTPQEYAGGHLENALNLNYYDPSFKRKIHELKKDEPVFVYCAVGGRSAAVAQVLKEQGFTHIIDLEGGITDWKRNGKYVK